MIEITYCNDFNSAMVKGDISDDVRSDIEESILDLSSDFNDPQGHFHNDYYEMERLSIIKAKEISGKEEVTFNFDHYSN